MRADRRFRAQVVALESRQVPGSVHYHPVAVVGKGTAVQTSSLPKTGGGMQVVDILNGRATDFGPFSGAITYSVGPKGGPVTGMGAIHTIHQYEVTFVLSGSVLKSRTDSKLTSDAFIFNVTGGTKRFAFATGQGQITATENPHTGHMAFRIKGLLEQLT